MKIKPIIKLNLDEKIDINNIKENIYIKKPNTNHRKFLKSKFGFLIMFFVVLPLILLSASVGIRYFQEQSASTLIITSTKPKPQTPLKTNSEVTEQKTSKITTTPKTTPTVKPYVDAVCSEIPIPYKTTYINVGYLDVGQTQELGGTDGIKVECTVASSTGYLPESYIKKYPINKTVYIGTHQIQINTGPTAEEIDYQRRVNLAQCLAALANAGAGTSSATEVCHQKFGY